MDKTYSMLIVPTGFTVMYLVNLARPESMPPDILSNLAFTTIFLITAVSFHSALRVSGWNLKDRFIRGLSMAALCFTLWLVGLLTTIIYWLITGFLPPYPSMIDLIWVLGYVFLILGFYYFTSGLFEIMWDATKSHRKRYSLIIFPAILFAVTVSSLSVVNPLKFVDGSSLVNVNLLNTVYLVFDVILLSLALLNLVFFYRGFLGFMISLISGGVGLGMLSDLFFMREMMEGWYYPGNLYELFAIWGFMLAALGAVLFTKKYVLPT